MMTKGVFSFIFFILLIMLAGLYFGSKIFLPIQEKDSNEIVEIKIRNGLSVKAIADTLEKNGVIDNAKDFIFTTKFFGKVTKLKAGKYDLHRGLSPYKAMKVIVDGKISSTRVVIPEGATSYQIASLLSKKVEVDSANFIDLVNNPEFISSIGLETYSLEGYLFPNTYSFYWGIVEEEIIKTLVKEFHRNFTDSLKQEVIEKGWSVHQILTLASIIEGEAMVDSERAIISAVYHNRLKKGILLQADPTIQYIIPDGPRRLLKRDLEIDSSYNTYRYPGLPPGPVNNPGLQSILAAINPAQVDYIYFVAKGDGSHIFSRTWNEHLRAKAKFDQYRRMINRQKRMKEASRK
ncbi:MAG: endolytic transglycosylase MltG [bacterium]|nr:MAG: endolytic transglycosylase MltG [bacterium]